MPRLNPSTQLFSVLPCLPGVTPDGQSQYSPIISFVHVDPHAEVEYLQIYTSFTATAVPLEISGDHFLYLYDDKVVQARDVQVGDILKGDAATTNTVVTHIQHIQRQGLYAPVTETGTIWVSGAIASSYISLINDDHHDIVVSPNMQVVLSHMALSPLRMVCKFGSPSICQNETYSDDGGYSMNLWMLIQLGHHFLTLTTIVQVWILMVVTPLLLVLRGMEMALHHGMYASMLTIGLVVVVSKMKSITKMTKK
jgi:hypothetical protein